MINDVMKKTIAKRLSVFLSLLFMVAIVLPHSSIAQVQQKRNSKMKIKAKMGYLVYLPKDYKKNRHQQWPLMLFLHGSGERGTNLDLVKKNGPPKLVEEGKDFPFIIISPQCPEGQWWSVDVLNALLDKLIRKYRIDEDRIYLTDLSMGGFGTWDFAQKHPERFAAIAPVCGGGDTINIDEMKSVPAWAFHGGKDNVVPPQRSKDMVNALTNNGGEAKLTIYPDDGHDSWTHTYNNEELYQWLLSHKRKTIK